MFSGRGSYGGHSSYNPAFARTFASGGGSFQSTRVSGPPSRSQEPPAPQTTTSEYRPGEPHYHSTRPDRAAGLVINPLCRCQNPRSHRDAWAIIEEGFAVSRSGRFLSWKEYANRVLDFHGKDSVTYAEENACLVYILDPMVARALVENYNDLCWAARMGYPIQIRRGPGIEHEFHNSHGHAQYSATESGLRTMVNRPEYPGQGPTGGFGPRRR